MAMWIQRLDVVNCAAIKLETPEIKKPIPVYVFSPSRRCLHVSAPMSFRLPLT